MPANLKQQFEKTIAQVVEYQNNGQPRPTWLQKKVDATHLSVDKPEQGLTMLINALWDERKALNQAGKHHG